MIECLRCNSSGQIVATKKSDNTIHAFKCTCEIPERRKLAASYPAWNDSLRSEFDVAFERIQVSMTIKPKMDFKVRAANPADEKDDEDSPF